MIWLLAGLALGGEIAVVAREGAIRPGVATTLLVAATDDAGQLTEPPPMRVEAGTLRESRSPTPDGVQAWLWHPPAKAGPVTLTLGGKTHVLDVAVPGPGPLELPRQVDGLVGRAFTLELKGKDLPAADDLAVEVPEGRVLGIERSKDTLQIRIEPGPAEYARYLPVAVRDLRSDTAPAFTRVRLRARASVALDTEPKTQATFEVGGRIYGPFTAGDDGVVRATVDQYPGETTVRVLLEDDLGNETTGALPLRTRAESRLLAVVAGELAPGRRAPLVYLHGLRADGRPWDGGAPFCRTPGAREVPLTTLAPGTWLTTVPLDHQVELLGSRFVCTLPDGVEAAARVLANEEVPARLRVHVWPEDLSTDRPIAQVSAALENSRGERLPSAEIGLRAEIGAVRIEPAGGFVLEGEYRGEEAVGVGGDTVSARWDPKGGLGRVEDLQIGWGEIESDALEVHVRALDDAGLPRVGAEVGLVVGDTELTLRTNSEGWASTFVPWLGRTGPVAIEARAAGVVRRELRLPEASAWRAPGTPLLFDDASVTISAGRIASIRPTVDPAVLYTGPRASASVLFEVLDRAGQGVQDVEIAVTASEGTLSEVSAEPDGRYRVELRPDPGDRQREVQITATVEGASATATLLLEPRPVDRAISLAAGIQTNLRRVTSPALSLDVDQRLPFFNRSTLLRVGFALYGADELVPASEPTNDDDVLVSLRLVPITVALAARREAGGRAFWLGLGGVVTGYSITASYGPERFGNGYGVLTPGPTVLVGAGQRFSGGELMAEGRFTAINGPAGDISFTKQVGGIGLWVGYRLIY
ncbi:MAG: hypothetical protein EP330_11730 [Deltaproteobacteria bacterium]|nr:MAG: hypothetical protein EP330_11730 [Deltaproteobacteria bacterium]